MRSVFLIGVAVFIIVAAGALSLSWYGQAVLAEQAVIQSIQQMNAAQKVLTYESIETSGFPMHIYVTITKPHFSGPVDRWIPTNPFFHAPLWHEDFALDGILVLGINAWSDQYSLQIKGPVKETATIGEQTFSSLYETSGSADCMLQLHHRGGIFGELWDFGALAKSADVIRDLRTFDCMIPDFTTTDATSNELLSTNSPAQLHVVNASEENRYIIHISVETGSLDMFPAGDARYAAYLKALQSNRRQVEGARNFLAALAQSQKQNIYDFTLAGDAQHISINDKNLADIVAMYGQSMTQTVEKH